jgi:predicted PurR-regulated permease PerM
MNRPRLFLAGLVGVLLALSIAFVLPFLDYFLLAVLLAYILRPLQRRLRASLGPRVAAGGIVVVAAVTIVVPTILLIRTAFTEGQRLLVGIRAGEYSFGPLEAWILELTGLEVEIQAILRNAVRGLGVNALSDVIRVLGAMAHVLLGVGLTLFLLYYFLKDGPQFVRWLKWRLPLRRPVRDELLAEMENITRAVLVGHVLVAIIQGLIAGAGLWALGIPNAAFWTVVMIVLAVLPIIGSFMVWGPAVAWLIVVGRPLAGIALGVYGTVVVGVSDDYLRPVIVDHYARINPAVVLIGVLGGIYVIGVMGIFFGPIVIGALRAGIDVYDREIRNSGV